MWGILLLRIMTWLGLASLVVLLGVYLVLLVYPSYAGGLAWLSNDEIWDGQHRLPFYGENPYYADPLPRFVMEFFGILLLTWLPLLIMSVGPVALRRNAFNKGERLLYPGVAIGTTIILICTVKAAFAVVIWILD